MLGWILASPLRRLLEELLEVCRAEIFTSFLIWSGSEIDTLGASANTESVRVDGCCANYSSQPEKKSLKCSFLTALTCQLLEIAQQHLLDSFIFLCVSNETRSRTMEENALHLLKFGSRGNPVELISNLRKYVHTFVLERLLNPIGILL